MSVHTQTARHERHMNCTYFELITYFLWPGVQIPATPAESDAIRPKSVSSSNPCQHNILDMLHPQVEMSSEHSCDTEPGLVVGCSHSDA